MFSKGEHLKTMRLLCFLALVTVVSTQPPDAETKNTSATLHAGSNKSNGLLSGRGEEEDSGGYFIGDLVSSILNQHYDEKSSPLDRSQNPEEVLSSKEVLRPEEVFGVGSFPDLTLEPILPKESSPRPDQSRQDGPEPVHSVSQPSAERTTAQVSSHSRDHQSGTKQNQPPSTTRQPQHTGAGSPMGFHPDQPQFQPEPSQGHETGFLPGLPQYPPFSTKQPQQPGAGFPQGFPQQPHFPTRQAPHSGEGFQQGFTQQPHLPTRQHQHPGAGLPPGFYQQPPFSTERPQYPGFPRSQLPYFTGQPQHHGAGYSHEYYMHPNQVPFQTASDPPGAYTLRSQVMQNLELLVMKCLEKLPQCSPQQLHLPQLCKLVVESLGINSCVPIDPTKDMGVVGLTLHLFKEGIIATKDYIVDGAQFIYSYFH